MIRSKLSFLSTKTGERSLIQGLTKSRALALPHHTGERPALHLPCCAPLGKSHPLSGPQSPHLYQEGLALFLQSIPGPTTVYPHAGPCSTSLSLPKRGKETCVRSPGRARGSELSGCAGCCRVSESHTNPRAEKPHLPGNHSYPATPPAQTQPEAQPKNTPVFPRDPSPPCDPPQPGRVRKGQRPHCAEVETEARGWRLRNSAAGRIWTRT